MSDMKQHISLDFWGTLARPNPEFIEARYKLLREVTTLPVEYVTLVWLKLEHELDKAAMRQAVAQNVERNWVYLLVDMENDYPMTVEPIAHDTKLIGSLINKANELFLKFPPLLNSSAVTVIKQIQNNPNISLSVSSNTNFISGSVIDDFLSNVGLKFDFTTYSDLIGVSKPNNQFFTNVNDKLYSIGVNRRGQVFHYGDDNICDGQGASDYGFNSTVVTYDSLPIALSRHL